MTKFLLETLMDELAAACRQVDGMSRAYGWGEIESVEPPAAVIGWPVSVIFSQTYSAGDVDEGEDQYEVPVFVVHGVGGSARARRNTVARWISRDFRREINRYEYTGDPLVWVESAETDSVEIGGQGYLATLFTVRVET